MPPVSVGLIQMSCGPDPEKNFLKATGKIREAAALGARIICTQELFSSRYFCHIEDYENFYLAEPIPGPSTLTLGELAASLQVVIIASLFEKRAQGLYHNTVAVLDADGKLLGKYRKMHIPEDPGYYEKFYFTPGDLGYRVFDTRYGKIGTLICWDQWFPEAARITSLMGAELICYPTAIGWAKDQDSRTNEEQFQAWQTIQQGHAIANGVHVMAVNRVGEEAGMKFWGGSFIAGPFGKLLGQASGDQEEILIRELDLGQTEHYRRHWPFLRDRRNDSYDPIRERFIDSSALEPE